MAFVALFVPVDTLGVLLLSLSRTPDLPVEERKRLPWQSMLTAAGAGIGFLLAFAGNMVLVFLVLGYSVVGGQVLGEGGSRTMGKVARLFVVAFGVSVVRRGLPGFLGNESRSE